MTFHGKPRASHDVMHHVHESPPVMMIPLIVLATGAVLAGAVFHNYFVGEGRAEFWRDALFILPEHDSVGAAHREENPLWREYLPTIMGVCGITFAYIVYMFRQGLAAKIVRIFRPLHTLFYNKWFFDEIYDALFVRSAWRAGRVLSDKGDRGTIDRLGPDGIAAVSNRAGSVLGKFQSGYVYQYAFVMIIGLISAISWLIYRSRM
jgi:NADH-quinone oxidoreductase subunit L